MKPPTLRDQLESDWQTLQAMEPSNCGRTDHWGTPDYQHVFARFVENLQSHEFD